MAEHNIHSTSEFAEITEEQTELMDGVADSMKELLEKSEELNLLINKFKV